MLVPNTTYVLTYLLTGGQTVFGMRPSGLPLCKFGGPPSVSRSKAVCRRGWQLSPTMGVAWLLSALTAAQPYARIIETTVSPLRKIIDCRGGGSGSLACGAAVPNRTNFKDFCDLANIQKKTRLSGIVLDIVLIPSEDETLFLLDASSKTYLGGGHGRRPQAQP